MVKKKWCNYTKFWEKNLLFLPVPVLVGISQTQEASMGQKSPVMRAFQ